MDYSPWGRKKSDTTERLHSLTNSATFFFFKVMRFFFKNHLFEIIVGSYAVVRNETLYSFHPFPLVITCCITVL